MNEIVIATRGSKLALWQAEHVRARLTEKEPGLSVSLLVLKTQGDRVLDRALSEIGGKGLFTKEIEEALLDGRAHVAVHSMKDVPAAEPEGLVLCAVPPRADPRDALLLSPAHAALAAQTTDAVALVRALPAGAPVGTSSLRRACQLRRLRPDLTLLPLRGNVDTRLRKLESGEFAALILASAGLDRLGFSDRISARFSPVQMIPACGQGALALQCRTDAPAVQARLRALADEDAALAVRAERAFSQRLGGSCQTPLGAHATLTRVQAPGAAELHITGMVGSPDGSELIEGEHRGPASQAAQLGTELAEQLLARGAGALLRG